MRVVRLFTILISLLITPHLLFSQDTVRPDTTIKKTKIVEDDAVMSMLDSLATLKVFSDGSTASGKVRCRR